MEDGEKEKANMEEEIVLPGFRFHPTDEELVGFYLRRKVERKPLKIELIRQLDIYKYDPWDLPVLKVSSCSVDEKEYYFFCLRARKYRNSVRPNRVTGSGFWKATGIDKNIYSGTVAAAKDCIGLKKSLVYYKGKAGKGTKTDWMMHEFRLPPTWKTSNQHSNPLTPSTCDHQQQEAEDWTLCRIFKRVHNSFSSYKANVKKSLEVENSSGIECRNFQDLGFSQKIKHRNHLQDNLYGSQQASSISVAQSSYSSSNSNIWNLNGDQELFRDGTWDQLSPVVDSVRANNPAIVFGYYS